MKNYLLETKKCKVVFFGEKKVGKTSIILKYCKNYFSEQYETTSNSYNYQKFVPFEDYQTNIEFLIWDTGLAQRFRSMMLKFYSDADIIVLVYRDGDESFEEIKTFWYKEVKEQMINNPSKSFYNFFLVIYVAKNGCDKNLDISISQEEVEFVSKENINLRMISAKDNIGIGELFKSIGKEFLNKYK